MVAKRERVKDCAGDKCAILLGVTPPKMPILAARFVIGH
jgi:hypothetical protein